MAVFMVLTENPQDGLRSAIESKYPSMYHHWSSTVSFVRAPGTARELAVNLGIRNRNEEGGIEGVFEGAFVMRASPSYFGWSSTALWEWLKSSLEAEG